MRSSLPALCDRRAASRFLPRSAAKRACWASLLVGGSLWACPESPALRGAGQAFLILTLALPALRKPSVRFRGLGGLIQNLRRARRHPRNGVFLSWIAIAGLGASLTSAPGQYGPAWTGFLIGLWVLNLLEDFKPFSPCLLYTSPSPRDATLSRMPSSA